MRTWKVPALYPQTTGSHWPTAHATISGPGLAAPWHTEEAQAAELQHQTHVWAPPGLPLSPADSLPRPHRPHACPEVCLGGSESVSADRGRKGRRSGQHVAAGGTGTWPRSLPRGCGRQLAAFVSQAGREALLAWKPTLERRPTWTKHHRSRSALPPAARPVGSAFRDGPSDLGSRGLLLHMPGWAGAFWMRPAAPQSGYVAPDTRRSPEPWLALWRPPPCSQLDQNGPQTGRAPRS